MKRALVVAVAALIVLTGCSSGGDDKPQVITTTSAAPFVGDAVPLTDDLDACTLFTEAEIPALTGIAVVSEQASNSDATSGRAGPGRGCLYQTKVDGSIKTYGQVFFLLVKAVSATEAKRTFDANFSDNTLRPLAGIGEAAGYIGQQDKGNTEVDAAALRGSLVVVAKCLRTPDTSGKAPTTDSVVANCAVPLLHAIFARVSA